MNTSIRLFESGENRSPCSTVQEVVDAYLDEKRLQLAAGACCEKSVYRAEFYLKSFCEMREKDGTVFGDKLVSACKRNDLTKWLVAHPEWGSPYTKQDAAGCVVTCFRWADGELIDRCPYRRPKFFGAPMPLRPAIQPHQFRCMWRHARKAVTKFGKPLRTRFPFLTALAFMWHTGARTCEMREVLKSEIDWFRGVAELEEHKTVKATGETRMIPTRRVLRLFRLIERLGPKPKPGSEGYIFLNTQGRPWRCDRFAKEFRRYARLAGIGDEISAYCLRHGMCVRLFKKGRSDRQVANVLGHKGTRNVIRYSRTLLTDSDHLNDVVR